MMVPPLVRRPVATEHLAQKWQNGRHPTGSAASAWFGGVSRTGSVIGRALRADTSSLRADTSAESLAR